LSLGQKFVVFLPSGFLVFIAEHFFADCIGYGRFQIVAGSKIGEYGYEKEENDKSFPMTAFLPFRRASTLLLFTILTT